MRFTESIRKVFTYAAVATFASGAGYLAGAWVMIYGLKPEHPEIAPWRLFDGALSHLPALVISFTIFQLAALAFFPRRVSGIRMGNLVAIAGEVAGLFALVHGFLIDFTAFDSIWWLIVLSAPVMILTTLILLHFKRARKSERSAAIHSP